MEPQIKENRRRCAYALGLTLAVLSSGARAHPGGVDECGCHHDRKRGDYVCHWGQFAEKRFRNKREMLDQLGPNAKCQRNVPKKAPPSADCSKIKDPKARLACQDKLLPPK